MPVFFLLMAVCFAPPAVFAGEVVSVEKPAAARETYAPGEEVVISAEIKNRKNFTILVAARLKVIAPDGSALYNEEKQLDEISENSRGTVVFAITLPADAQAGVYTAQFELRNPYARAAAYFQNLGKPFVVFEVKPIGKSAQADPVEGAKKILSKMVDAMNWRNVDDLMAPLAPVARVSLKGRASDAAKLRESLNSVLPFLTDFVWDAQVGSAVRDPKSGAVRLRVTSSYSAKLAEPVGVTSASLAKPKELESEQKRITEAFNASAEEIYEFKADPWGKLQVTEIVSALPLDAKLFERIAVIGAEWEVKVAVFGLFYYIEQNDPGKFEGLIGADFVNNDDNGFKYGKTDLIESIKADLDHLTAIDHNVRVEDIQFNSDRTDARVPVTWDRRARISNTKSEWVIKDQKTTMTLRRGSGFRLAQIEGKPLFGNSSRMTRKTLIRSGELDGATVTKAIVISDSRDTAAATSADVPELPKEVVSTLGVSTEVSGGSISSNPTVDQTWKGNITIASSITIPSGVKIIVSSGATITLSDNVTITVQGTLEPASATFTSGTTCGLTVSSGGTVTASSTNFTWGNNSTITVASGGTLTPTSGTWSMGTGVTIAASGTLNATSVTFKTSSTKWSGMTIASGSAVTLTSCTLRDADTLIVTTAASPTIQNGTLYPNKCAIDVRSSGSLTISGNTITSASGSTIEALAVLVNVNSSAGITFSNNTISKLGGTTDADNIFEPNFFVYTGFTGSVTSSGNRFTGNHTGGSNAYSLRTRNGTFTFTNDVFTEYKVAIENDGTDGNSTTGDPDAASLTITNCDFTHCGTTAISGNDNNKNGDPNIQISNCYFQGNGDAHATGSISGTVTATLDGTGSDTQVQFKNVSAVTNPKTSANNP